MRIVFGWNRIKLKTFTFQELNLPELEQFPNAKIQVVQSYFHLFWIPFFPMGKRYDLVMNGQTYHVPPSLMKMIDKDQIKARGKWYAWTLPILAIVVFIGIAINGMYTDYKYRQESIEYAEMQRDYFDHPEIGDGIHFSDHSRLAFEGEVFDVTNSKVRILIDLMDQLDAEILENVEKGIVKTSADTLKEIMVHRNDLVNTSIYVDSLLQEHPDQPIYRKLLTFELETFPIKYEIIEMSIAEYKSLKKSIGDGYTQMGKAVKIPGFKIITKSGIYAEPADFD